MPEIQTFPTSGNLDRSETDRLTGLYKARTAASLDYNAHAGPELPQADAQELYERLLKAEAASASPVLREDGYDEGVARFDDEMRLLRGDGPALITTEHATAQRRTYKTGIRRKGPEFGLAALGTLVHEDAGATHLTMLGRQTGDPNHDRDHPFKDEISRLVRNPGTRLFASLHGMAAGHVSDLEDARAIDVVVGIGSDPTEKSVRHAEATAAYARDLGLRAGVNEPFVSLASKQPLEPRRNADGSIKTIRFGGGGNTTRQHAESAGGANLAALQVEYSSFLRLGPEDFERDYKSRYMGAYMGYLLLKHMVEITA